MYCKKCGSVIAPNTKFCSACGERVDTQNEQINNINQDNNIEIIDEGNNIEEINAFETKPNEQVNSIEGISAFETKPNEQVNSVGGINAFETKPNGQVNNIEGINTIPKVNQNINREPANKKSNLPFIIIVVILSIVIIGLIIFVCINLFGGEEEQIKEDNKVTEKDKNEKEEDTDKVSVNDKIKINNYEFILPTGYKNVEYEKSTLIMNDTQSAMFEMIGIVKGSLSGYASNSSGIQAVYEEAGYTINGSDIRKVGLVNYLLFDVTSNSENAWVFIAEINNENCLVGHIIISPSTTYDAELENLSKIILTAKETSSSLSSSSKDEEKDFMNSGSIKSIMDSDAAQSLKNKLK